MNIAHKNVVWYEAKEKSASYKSISIRHLHAKRSFSDICGNETNDSVNLMSLDSLWDVWVRRWKSLFVASLLLTMKMQKGAIKNFYSTCVYMQLYQHKRSKRRLIYRIEPLSMLITLHFVILITWKLQYIIALLVILSNILKIGSSKNSLQEPSFTIFFQIICDFHKSGIYIYIMTIIHKSP